MQSAKGFAQLETTMDKTSDRVEKLQTLSVHQQSQVDLICESAEFLDNIREQMRAMERWGWILDESTISRSQWSRIKTVLVWILKCNIPVFLSENKRRRVPNPGHGGLKIHWGRRAGHPASRPASLQICQRCGIINNKQHSVAAPSSSIVYTGWGLLTLSLRPRHS